MVTITVSSPTNIETMFAVINKIIPRDNEFLRGILPEGSGRCGLSFLSFS